MKALFILFFLFASTAAVNAQLAYTKWQGTMLVPAETKVVLSFKKDSVDMIVAETGEIGETMTFSMKDSSITMKKTSGFSPCNIGDTFKVRYTIKADQLFISNLSDPCPERIQAWLAEPFNRMPGK